MTMEDLENKFNSLVGDKFGTEAKNMIKEYIFNCENMSTGEFMNNLNVQ
jgi:hypothetical protein